MRSAALSQVRGASLKSELQIQNLRCILTSSADFPRHHIGFVRQLAKGVPDRDVVAHARRNRPRLTSPPLSEDDLNARLATESQYGVLTEEMLDQEPPGHRAGEKLQ
jgi:hypothetical protein